MTLRKILAWALCLAWWCLNCSISNSQTVDPTTGNLVNWSTSPTDTTSTWNNGVYVNTLCFQAGQPGNCGPRPSVNTNGNINFSYGTTDLNQIVNINRALAIGGSGVQLSGFNFGFRAKNGNGWDDGRQDYLDAYVKFYNAGGGLAASYDYGQYTNNRYNWTQFNFSETFSSPVAASNFSNAQFGFIGRDNNYWAGNYGPEITNVSFSLKYRVDPCSTNPAFSPTCAGFSSVATSGNLVPYPGAVATGGSSINNSFAINDALQAGSTGLSVYGFNYKFNYNLGAPTTTGCPWYGDLILGLFCGISVYGNTPLTTTNPSAMVKVDIRDSGNQSLYSQAYSYNTANTSGTEIGKYLLPSTTNSTLLGNFNFGATTSGSATISAMSVTALYKPDACIKDPLSNPSCPGYATAYAKNMILGSTVASASAPSAPPSPAPAPPAAAPDPNNSVPANTAPAPAVSAPPPQQVASAPQDPNQNPGAVQSNPAQPNPTQPGPQPAGAPQPAGGPQQTPGSSASSPSSSAPQQTGKTNVGPSSTAMSAVRSAQEKDKAIQQLAVQNAAKVVEASTQQSQATASAAIASLNDMSANSAQAAAQFSSQTTQSSFQTIQTGQTQQQMSQSIAQQTQQQQSSRIVQQTQQQFQQDQQTQQTQTYSGLIQITQSAGATQQQQDTTTSTAVAVLKPIAQAPIEIAPQASSGTGIIVARNPFAYNPLMPNTSMVIQQAPTVSTFQFRNEGRTTEVETPQIQVATISGMGRAGNPLSEIMMQQRFELMQNNIEQRGDSVNKNAQQNELAGGVRIEAMATQPRGFEAYSVVLKDAAFYEPKEIYKNQTTVDNIRALRQMASDRVYQEMLDMQYKLGE
jgi:hypothetical protein